MAMKPEDEPNPTTERIVEAFAERARSVGPHSVVMAELARDLGISTRTLYRHFRSKRELVLAVVQRFADDWARGHRRLLEQQKTPAERIRIGAMAWVEAQGRLPNSFWSDLRRHYPEAMTAWQEAIAPVWLEAYQHGRPALRDDLHPRLAFSLLLQAIRHAADADRCDRLGLSRREAVVAAVELWTRGAFKRPKLRVVADPED